MLPNLKSVTFWERLAGCDGLQQLIWAIAAVNQDPASPFHRKALVQLQEVNFDFHFLVCDHHSRMYAPFMALPSLRSLRGTYINDDAASNSVKFQVEEIRLINSSIGASSLRCMIEPMRALRVFTYSH